MEGSDPNLIDGEEEGHIKNDDEDDVSEYLDIVFAGTCGESRSMFTAEASSTDNVELNVPPKGMTSSSVPWYVK